MSSDWPPGFTPALSPGEERHTIVGDIVYSVSRLKPPGMSPREAVDALLKATDCACPPFWSAKGFHTVECLGRLRKYVEVLSRYVAEESERLL